MNIQLKKGILEALVLGALKKEDLYGYKLSERVNNILSISETALYPILRRLKMQEFLTTYSVEHNGRLRKYYRITEKGIAQLETYTDELIELAQIINNFIEEVEK